MQCFKSLTMVLGLSICSAGAQAGLLNVWGGNWTQFDKPIVGLTPKSGNAINPARAYDVNGNLDLQTNDDNYIRERQNQQFDAEYLFFDYNKVSKDLSIGLQTGFDLVTGFYDDGYQSVYVGDLRLNFGTGIDYALDFGLETRTTGGAKRLSGSGDAGVYSLLANEWSTETFYEPGAVKWARTGGQKIAALSQNLVGQDTSVSYVKVGDGSRVSYQPRQFRSYFRKVTFNLEDVLGSTFDFTQDFEFTTDWIMSCYNDAIHGKAVLSGYTPPVTPNPVSTPASLALFALGLFAIGLLRRR